MPIICQICNKEFEKQITNSHLRTHSITTIAYKQHYGDLSSIEYKQDLAQKKQGQNNPNYNHRWTEQQKQALSKKKIGSIPWNKGLQIESSQKMKDAIAAREEKYKTGELVRASHTVTNEIKQQLSLATSHYAMQNPNKIKERASKAIETKRKLGYDLGKNMRGKKHSEATKIKLVAAAQVTNQKKIDSSIENMMLGIEQANLKLTKQLSKINLQLQCKACGHKFTFTKQNFIGVKQKTKVCIKCFPRVPTKNSKGELELFDFIKLHCSDAISGYREKYHDKEIDIFIPSKNIGFEFNGLYWHSEQVLLENNKSAKSDFEKQQYMISKNIRLVQIFEDEWEHKKEIVEHRILNILGVTSDRIYARKCSIKEVTSKDASLFCNTHHIMGSGRSNIRLGLYHNDELVSLMTFTKNNISRKLKDIWEINRFVSKGNLSVVGGAGKLFSHFIKTQQPKSVISYADTRWSSGGLYKQLGFIKTSEGVPNYWYFLPNKLKRIHRYSLRKNKEDDQSLTEYENRVNQGYSRIWDCGSSKWEYKPPLTI